MVEIIVLDGHPIVIDHFELDHASGLSGLQWNFLLQVKITMMSPHYYTKANLMYRYLLMMKPLEGKSLNTLPLLQTYMRAGRLVIFNWPY